MERRKIGTMGKRKNGILEGWNVGIEGKDGRVENGKMRWG